ncbi:tRNA threonylcarbamoyladenosine dehydratase [Pseudenhygromyxa sp. WMMC2535]|uniref:tRNA threonylcarbamoyladenosine dehydratase n=1 Tax=Pseudenhygromyxa sp. WMMC2535 TaxID=2712867 RepID=UPI001557FCC9|nr:tRNA threonylcarbamoyladenosine dehydratase [Pseudenhygromyxa sp. WMMC2535]NVB40851.1 tRNA threonylcarbamoyladenosine dehydratase [Pseudenhygromyxa sp. WMMC2535]
MSDDTSLRPLPWEQPQRGGSASALLSLRKPTSDLDSPDSEAEPDDGPVETPYRLHRRFDRMGRLVGDAAMRRLLDSHVMVIGLGGVGSWAAEALARAGVGRLTLVDFDLVCVTNANRQLHAMRGTTGKAKATVMAERLQLIHPSCAIEGVRSFYDAETSEDLLARAPDLIVDAIDNLTAKAHLIARCRERALPLIVSGGASGRLDPTQVRVGELGRVTGDPFLAALRKHLRQRHDFPRAADWGVPAVYSLEPPAAPLPLAYDGGEGFRCVCPQGDNGKHTCDARNLIYGTAGFVTGSFGFACAAEAVRRLSAPADPATAR